MSYLSLLINRMAVPGLLLSGFFAAGLTRLTRALVVTADDVGWVRAHQLLLVVHHALLAVI